MIKSIVVTSLIVLASLFLAFYFLQRSLIYFPNKSYPTLLAYHATDMQEVIVETEDRLKLHAWYKKAKPKKPSRHIAIPSNTNFCTKSKNILHLGSYHPHSPMTEIIVTGDGFSTLYYTPFRTSCQVQNEKNMAYQMSRFGVEFCI